MAIKVSAKHVGAGVGVALSGGLVAMPAGAIKAPFGGPFADNPEHTYVSIESDAFDRSHWDPLFDGILDTQYDQKTVLFENELSAYSSNVDLYWYVAPHTDFPPNVLGDAQCIAFTSGGLCNRFRVRISLAAYYYPGIIQKNLVCHETGHTVGFDDGGNDGTSCMDGGDNSQIFGYEIGKINGYY